MKAYLFKSLLVFMVMAGDLFAIGSLQIGVYTGLYPDINNLSTGVRSDGGDTATGAIAYGNARRDSITYYDNLIQQAAASKTAEKGSPMGSPLGATLGLDVRYHWNSLFVRLGFDYSMQLTGTSGSLETGLLKDAITYDTWAASLPITIGFSHALADFFHFYMGLGPYYGVSSLTVTHSEPSAFNNIGNTSIATAQLPYKKVTMTGDMLGVHLLVGIQVPIVVKKVYLSVDYMLFRAQSDGVKLEGTNADDTPIPDNSYDVITQRGSKILLGIQYYIDI